MSDIKDLVIVGAGPAGLSAALYAQRAMLDTVVYEREATGGQIILSSDVDNYPGVPHTDGFTLADTMRQQAEDFGAQISMKNVYAIEHDDKTNIFKVVTNDDSVESKTIIFASGATPRPAGFKGEGEFVGRGVSYCATCDAMFYRNKEVYVIGGGNSACEEALFLTKFASKVTLIVRKDHLRAQALLAQELEQNDKVEIRFLTSIVAAGGNFALSWIDFKNNETGEITHEEFDEASFGIFVFVGRNPESSLIENLVDRDEFGYVITNEDCSTRTPGLFCVGDVRQKSLRQIVTAAADGAIAATAASAYLGHPVSS